MNFKFLGNSIDLMKYDMLTYLVKSKYSELFYVPMITEPQPKAYDPKLMVYELGRKNEELYNYLKGLFNTEEVIDPSCVREYFDQQEVNCFMHSRMRASTTYFSNDDRKLYFHRALTHYTNSSDKTFIYIDPDVGCDINLKRRYRSNRQMYIREDEIKLFASKLKDGDTLAFFQHLGNSHYDLESRLSDLKDTFGQWVFVAGYTRIQGSLVFIFNNEDDYQKQYRNVNQYFKRYENLKHSDKIILQ